jgi:hypothetical protein
MARVYGRSLAGIACSNPARGMDGCPSWVLCALSDRGLCDVLITHPEESYRLSCVLVCDLGTSRMRRLKLIKGCKCRIQKKKYWYYSVVFPLSLRLHLSSKTQITYNCTMAAFFRRPYSSTCRKAANIGTLRSFQNQNLSTEKVLVLRTTWQDFATHRVHLELMAEHVLATKTLGSKQGPLRSSFWNIIPCSRKDKTVNAVGDQLHLSLITAPKNGTSNCCHELQS